MFGPAGANLVFWFLQMFGLNPWDLINRNEN